MTKLITALFFSTLAGIVYSTGQQASSFLLDGGGIKVEVTIPEGQVEHLSNSNYVIFIEG